MRLSTIVYILLVAVAALLVLAPDAVSASNKKKRPPPTTSRKKSGRASLASSTSRPSSASRSTPNVEFILKIADGMRIAHMNYAKRNVDNAENLVRSAFGMEDASQEQNPTTYPGGVTVVRAEPPAMLNNPITIADMQADVEAAIAQVSRMDLMTVADKPSIALFLGVPDTATHALTAAPFQPGQADLGGATVFLVRLCPPGPVSEKMPCAEIKFPIGGGQPTGTSQQQQPVTAGVVGGS